MISVSTPWMPLLAASVDGRWVPGIGDPSIGGWLTVAGYVAAAVLSWRAAKRQTQTVVRWTWLLIAVAMAFLAVNKQLDLQSAMTQLGRIVAKQQGWHHQRRQVQVAFIYSMLGAGAVFFLGLIILLRHHVRALWLPVLGLVTVIVFVIIRAASFHGVDHLIGRSFLGLRWNWILEGTGIVMVIVAGILATKRSRGHVPSVLPPPERPSGDVANSL